MTGPTNMASYKLLIHSADQLVQVVADGERFLKGDLMKNVVVLEKRSEDDGISLVIGRDGNIVAVGHDSIIQLQFQGAKFDKILNAKGKSIVPGLIDAHSHPVWAGDRVHEFALKLEGASYMDIHHLGGGIGFTVEHTKNTSEEDLLEGLLHRMTRMLYLGTTLAEAKSGYGLTTESEVKLLRVLNRAADAHPLELSITFCGAHSVPKGLTSEEATQIVLQKMLPTVRQLRDKGEIRVDNLDVFCEEGVFSAEQTKRILEAGRHAGFMLNFHGDELNQMGAAEMGASLGAEAISHLEEISDIGIDSMSRSGSVAVILPTTVYILRLKPPPVRTMIKAGVIVALGSDFNPNAYCMSMPMVMHLACVLCGMSMTEALIAATINSAAALGKSTTHGSLEVGKRGDVIIIDAPRWEHLIYQFGCHDVINCVIKSGEIVFEKDKGTGKNC